MVTCLAVFEATSSASRVSRKSAYDASFVVASWRRASTRSRLLNSRRRLHLLLEALELGRTHAVTIGALSAS